MHSLARHLVVSPKSPRPSMGTSNGQYRAPDDEQRGRVGSGRARTCAIAMLEVIIDEQSGWRVSLLDGRSAREHTEYISCPEDPSPSPPGSVLGSHRLSHLPRHIRRRAEEDDRLSTPHFLTPVVRHTEAANALLVGTLGTLQCVFATSWRPILFTTSQVPHTDLCVLLLPDMQLPPLLRASPSRLAATRLDRSQTGSRSLRLAMAN